jgi:hypothetical protein
MASSTATSSTTTHSISSDARLPALLAHYAVMQYAYDAFESRSTMCMAHTQCDVSATNACDEAMYEALDSANQLIYDECVRTSQEIPSEVQARLDRSRQMQEEREAAQAIEDAKPKPSFSLDWDCYETCPCQHDVIFADGTHCCLDAREIAELYRAENLEVPSHFTDDGDEDDGDEDDGDE